MGKSKNGGRQPLGSFKNKLSMIANAAAVMGEKYKEKKLVKKLIRCLPK